MDAHLARARATCDPPRMLALHAEIAYAEAAPLLLRGRFEEAQQKAALKNAILAALDEPQPLEACIDAIMAILDDPDSVAQAAADQSAYESRATAPRLILHRLATRKPGKPLQERKQPRKPQIPDDPARRAEWLRRGA